MYHIWRNNDTWFPLTIYHFPSQYFVAFVLLRSNPKMAAEVKVMRDGQENPTAVENQNALAEGIMQIFKPAVEELDDKVLSVRYSNNLWNVLTEI